MYSAVNTINKFWNIGDNVGTSLYAEILGYKLNLSERNCRYCETSFLFIRELAFQNGNIKALNKIVKHFIQA